MKRHIIATLTLTALLAASSYAQLTMTVQPTIEGFVPNSGPIAMRVEFDNDGPDARGVLRVMGQSFRTDYPVEIPQGANKQLMVYPSVDYGETRFLLITNRGQILFNYSPERKWEQGQQVLLEISDTPGDLGFIRPPNSGNGQNQVQDAYCQPRRAPDRPVGYAGIGAVVLGQGSERLTDREIEAIKIWTISGGTLVFVGGASAPILNNPQWAQVLPATGFRSENVAGSPTLRELGKHPTGEFALTTGTPIPTANAKKDGDTLISAERQFGLGRVIYLAFNPLETPLNKWEGRRAAMLNLIRPAELNGRRIFVGGFSQEQTSMPGGFAPAAGVPGAMPILPAATPQTRDPFSTKLPPAGQVFLVLGIYFIAVVPINFIVLKKLNRGELAWFTAPILSLIFAGILFTRAQDLYSAQLSSASQGILVAQQGMPQGMFIGSSQLFIPRGGSYDLKFSNVDSVGTIETEDYSYYNPTRRNATVDLDPIDDGEIHVSAMRANNLAFREISYRQVVPEAGDWMEIRKVDGGKSYEVLNRGPYDIEKPVLFVGKQGYWLPKSIPAGGRQLVILKKAEQAWDQGGPGLASVLTSKSVAVMGKLVGLRPGPQLGLEVGTRTNVQYAFISNEVAH